jgi:hypothetical protein
MRQAMACGRAMGQYAPSLRSLGSRNAVSNALRYRAQRRVLSVPDSFALALAKERAWSLLTGDNQLRDLAAGEDVECHGVLWLLDRMEEAGYPHSRRYTTVWQSWLEAQSSKSIHEKEPNSRFGGHRFSASVSKQLLPFPEWILCSVCAPLRTEPKHRVKTGYSQSPERGAGNAMFFVSNLLSSSQAGRRGFESRLPLHLFNLHASPNQLLSHLSQLDADASDCSALKSDQSADDTSRSRASDESTYSAR